MRMHMDEEARKLEERVEKMRVQNMQLEDVQLMADVKKCYKVLYVKDVEAQVYHKY